MIKTLRGKISKDVWKRKFVKKLLVIQPEAWESLSLLDSIGSLEQLKKIPSINLHKLTGDREKQWAFWVVKTKYRVCFYWKDGNAYDVEIVDYH